MTGARAPFVLRVEGGGSDPSRCPLCGEPNACAIAAGEGRADAPCWCVSKAFPARLTDRADAADGGAACICARCLEADSELA